jgi:hypothetical protein
MSVLSQTVKWICSLCRSLSTVIPWIISVIEDTSDITRSISSVSLVCQMVTCAFDASQFEMAVISGVPISLTVCRLSNIPVVFGWFEFYFALYSALNMSLLFGAGFSHSKNFEWGSLALYYLIFQIFVTVFP